MFFSDKYLLVNKKFLEHKIFQNFKSEVSKFILHHRQKISDQVYLCQNQNVR